MGGFFRNQNLLQATEGQRADTLCVGPQITDKPHISKCGVFFYRLSVTLYYALKDKELLR